MRNFSGSCLLNLKFVSDSLCNMETTAFLLYLCKIDLFVSYSLYK
ncbi:hypothetical protein CoNPh26_CDS0093 [Staphylococcus phage S-CoN_Ph26]|nr:hypothetical protein CoNPh26_CDS0093 [Staphylococcus phage S-CoN_Ph26]